MKKYLQYKATEFAEDLDFIKWVQSDFTECADMWDTFMNDNPSMGDEISEAIDIIELFQFQEPKVTSAQQDNLLKRIHTTMEQEDVPQEVVQPKTSTVTKPQSTPTPLEAETSSKSILRFLIPLAAAAALAVFAIFNFGGEASSSSMRINDTGIAQTSNLTLPDQSTVNLNATSSLSFDENNFSNDRTLKLEGEAFFNVEKGQRFVIETKNGSIEVLGTSFNVFSRNQSFEVECLTGKVKVVNKSGTASIVLSPNESCNLVENKLLKKTINSKESDWTKGIYHFEETELSAVVGELERQFKVSIEIPPGLEIKKYTGSFDKKNLKDAIHAVTWPLGLEYSIDEKVTNDSGKQKVVFKVAE